MVSEDWGKELHSLLCNRLGDTRHTRLCERIVDLSRISIQTTGTRDVDDIPGLAVLHTEVGRRSAHNLERRGRVQVDNGVPLLISHLVDDAVPCVARVIDDDVDLAVVELASMTLQLLCGGISQLETQNP